MKTAILSNINMDACIRLLKRDADVYDGEGYGNELGTLMNPASSLYAYAPEIIFIVEDLCELIGHNPDEKAAKDSIASWFDSLRSVLRDDIIYYIADAYAWGGELAVVPDNGKKIRLELLWQQELDKLTCECTNTRIFPYRRLIEQAGEAAAFSLKTWYMGRIPHSLGLQQSMVKEMYRLISIEKRTPMKVLALDLDNTLWGGLAGEADITPIELSDDHSGLAFKNLQRIILQLKQQGVLLTIVSKNNEKDAWDIIDNHPHMILRRQDFVATRINWDNKADSLVSIAKELNLGLDSFVFFDDNPTERDLIIKTLPQVVVPDFPSSPEDLPQAMITIWKDYFARPVVTNEDKDKTKQYQANTAREQSRIAAGSFDEYLKGLDIVLTRVNESRHTDRILQMLNKTNQFNLTTRRHTLAEIQEYLSDRNRKVFVYSARDVFGDYGIIVVAVTRILDSALVIEELVMSCRVMGKLIENAIIHDIENWAASNDKVRILGLYRASSKNQPVTNLYPGLSYSSVDDSTREGMADYLPEAKGEEYSIYCYEPASKSERNYILRLDIEA